MKTPPKPRIDTRDIDGIWTLAVRVYEALEAADGNRDRANQWHCEFMKAKDIPGDLLPIVEKYVEIIE